MTPSRTSPCPRSVFRLIVPPLALLLLQSVAAYAQDFDWVREFGTNRDDQVNAVAASLSGVYVGGNTIGIFPGQAGTLNDIDAFVARYDNAGNQLWVRQFGSTTVESDTVQGIAADGTGVYAVGSTNGGLPGQGNNLGTGDIFVRKYDVDGNELWTHQFGSASQDLGLAAAVDSTGVYVAGKLNGHGVIRKYDQSGVELWTRMVDSGSVDEVRGIAAGASGVYVTGLTNGVLAQPGVGGSDVYLRKYDVDGNVIWTRQFGSVATDQGNAVAVDFTGVYVAGDTTGAFAGQNHLGGLWDEFAAMFDFDGNQKWLHQFGTPFEDAAFGVAVNGTGAYFVGFNDGAPLPGETALGGWDAWVRRYDSVGNEIETRQFGSNSNDQAYGVAADSTGVYIGGWASGAFPDQMNSGGSDGFVLRIPPEAYIYVGGVVNSASFALHPAPVAPGSIAAAFGANLNDGSVLLNSALDENGKVVTTLGGSSATVDGIPAPMFYSTLAQIGIQIPFEVAGQETATLVVTVDGKSSVPRTFNLAPTAPGVFTANQGGTGIAAIAHEDGITPVTVQNPAHPNEVVVIYLTGLGALLPPLTTGELAGANLSAAAPIVTVDGAATEILYSGAAPGSAGQNQINFRIPPGTRTASDIPVVVSIGGRESNLTTIPVGP
jgi:uncharacterized protein (TIGR03437 family)